MNPNVVVKYFAWINISDVNVRHQKIAIKRVLYDKIVNVAVSKTVENVIQIDVLVVVENKIYLINAKAWGPDI